MTISDYFRRSKWYFISMLAFLTTFSVLLLIFGKSASFMSINSFHPFLLNVFFINYTFMGDGIFALCLIAVYLFYFKKKRAGYAMLNSFLISGLLVQTIKNLVSAPRPRLFFEAGQYLHYFDGISLANNSSFPSGHTATAFAIATVLVLTMRNKRWQLLILLSAVMVGYSRIYLAQHFLLDVIIGAIIGSLSGIAAVYLALNIKTIRLSIRKMHRIETKRVLQAPPAVQAS